MESGVWWGSSATCVDTRVKGRFHPYSCRSAPTENMMAQSALQLLVRVQAGQAFDAELLNARLDERFGARRLQRPESAVALQATWLERPRFVAAIFGTTAGIALLLAAIGVFALASFDAARRRHEMAIRSALGATAADLRRLVRRGVVRPVFAGALAGLLVSWWAAQFVQSLIVDLDARHPAIHGAVLVVLVSVAAVAAWLPARRASRVDPAETFRAM
jgi:ABC-type antimicrobial peptide transport system permease subunit